jgi:hypothetical protein
VISIGELSQLRTMNTTQPLPLPGGLSPRQFMSRHWQKKPLLVRGARLARAREAVRRLPASWRQAGRVQTAQDT